LELLRLSVPSQKSLNVVQRLSDKEFVSTSSPCRLWIVVDEIDDAVGILRHLCLGVAAEIGLVVAGVLGIGAIGAAVVAGAEVQLICSGLIMLGVAATLKIHALRP